MRVYDQLQNIDLEIDIPSYVHISQNSTYIPLVNYVNLDTNEFIWCLYVGETYTKEAFEKALTKTLGKKAVYKNSQVYFLNWNQFSDVNNYLYLVEDESDTKNIIARYHAETNTLTVGPSQFVTENFGDSMVTVIESGFSKASFNKIRIGYQLETGLDFRFALHGEVLNEYPRQYVVGANLKLSNGIGMEFLIALRTAKNYKELKKAVEKLYELDSQSYRLTVMSIPIIYASQDLDSIHNFGRVDKYRAILDLEQKGVHLRTFRDLNPLFTSIKPEIPPISPKHRLYSVYEF